MNFKNALRAGIVFGAAFAATLAIAQAYTVGPNDTVKINMKGNGGSYQTPTFFSAVNTAVANDNAVATNPCVATSPSVTSGFGTNAAVTNVGANCAFSMSSGTTNASNGVIAMPQAAHGWYCDSQDVTTNSNAMFMTKMTNETANSVTIDGFQSNGAVGNWVANDVLVESCQPF